MKERERGRLGREKARDVCVRSTIGEAEKHKLYSTSPHTHTTTQTHTETQTHTHPHTQRHTHTETHTHRQKNIQGS